MKNYSNSLNLYVNNELTMGGGIAPKSLSINYILKITLKNW